MRSLETRAFDYINRHSLIESGQGLYVAVSGGPDSVALLRVLTALRETLALGMIEVLHFNHRLRGEASDGDAAFVKALAESLGLLVHMGGEDVKAVAEKRGMSIEMAARQCRKDFFDHVRARFGMRPIAVGHNADDQAEELLLRIFRGTGPSGLAGMRNRSREGVIRPLLFAKRADILEYLQITGADYRVDQSNLDPFCQRNTLRLEILPLIEKHFHRRVSESLCRCAELARDEEEFWEAEIASVWLAVCRVESEGGVILDVDRVAELPIAMRRRLYRHALECLRGSAQAVYAVHLEAVDRLTTGLASGKGVDLPGDLMVSREHGGLIFGRKRNAAATPFCHKIDSPGEYSFGDFRVRIEEQFPCPPIERPVAAGTPVALLDAGKVKWPLILRSRLPGDRFRPLGMKGTKKLQDIFTDDKIPLSLRDRIPLLCDRDGILWVTGARMAERARVDEHTRGVLNVEVRMDDFR